MNDLVDGIAEARRLIVAFDEELVEISLRSLQVTVSAVIIASVLF